jgi:hypothetical protein
MSGPVLPTYRSEKQVAVLKLANGWMRLRNITGLVPQSVPAATRV